MKRTRRIKQRIFMRHRIENHSGLFQHGITCKVFYAKLLLVDHTPAVENTRRAGVRFPEFRQQRYPHTLLELDREPRQRLVTTWDHLQSRLC